MKQTNGPDLGACNLLKGAIGASTSMLVAGVGVDRLSAGRTEEGTVAAADCGYIRRENERLGADDWQLTRVRVDDSGIRSPWIEGYCSRQSVAAGETLDIMVSTDPPEKFQIEIFRTGFYGGRGARLMKTLGPFRGKKQPTPEPGKRLLRECGWEPAVELQIPDDWTSGVYLGRLTLLTDSDSKAPWQSYVVFIVRDERPADILLQCSDNTWQAYNRWPSRASVYDDGTRREWYQGGETDVSFDRPYGMYRQLYKIPQSVGSGEWLCFEFPLGYWLEENGYDVSYCANSDMITPARGLKCKAFLSVGHDEYWDIRQYESVVKMRDAGVSLLFLSGNSVCWVTPLTASNDGRAVRTMTRGGPYGGQHKWAKMRDEKHGPFAHRGPDEGYLMGARNVSPITGAGDWIVVKPEHWMFRGTGMKRGEGIPGLVGWEYHGDPPGDLPGLQVVAEGTALSEGVTPQHWTATIYPGPKNNFVFNAATIFWCQGLARPPGHMIPWTHWTRPHGPDRRVQQMTHNLLRRAIQA